MAISLFVSIPDKMPATTLLNIALSGIFIGLVLAWIAAGTLLIEVWRSTPRVRFLLAVPLLPFLILLFLTLLRMMHIGLSVDTIGAALTPVLPFLLYSYPLVSTLLVNRAIRRAAIADVRPRETFRISFVVVGAMVLILLGGLLLSLSLMLFASLAVWLPFLSGLCIAVIIAVHTLFSRPRSHNQAHPKDDSPSGFDQHQEPRGYRG